MTGGLAPFFLAAGILALLRIVIGITPFPLAILPTVNLVITILFIATPIVGLFYGSNHYWTPKLAAFFVVGGILVQAAFVALDILVFHHKGLGSGIAIAINQVGLLVWCVGLGALLATLVKERNILIPIAIFLAIFDFFLVFSPVGVTKQLLQKAPNLLPNVGAQIPMAVTMPTEGRAVPSAYVGMADVVFLAMFFIALFRFHMRTRETLRVVIPALIIYLMIVLFLGDIQIGSFSLGTLPALVPIGLSVLFVNRKEFQLTKEEKQSTIVVAIIGLAILVWGFTRKPQVEQPAPGPSVNGQAPAGSTSSPGPASPDRPR